MDDLRYPIGRFVADPSPTPASRQAGIAAIAGFPRRMREVVAGLSPAQLETPYRPEGWTVRQVVHHVADSHINAYVRFRLALTEDEPLVRTYEEGRWAELGDARGGPVEVSLRLLEPLHERWVSLLESLTEADFARPLRHPDLGRVSVDYLLQNYAWHGRHHVAHIAALRAREDW